MEAPASITPGNEVAPTSRQSIIGITAGLALAVICIYAQVRSHQFTNFDDPIYVTDNSHVTAGLTLDGLRWAMTSMDGGIWLPLTWLTHMADVQFFGLDAGAHLLTNAALHLANSVLLFSLLLIATGRVWRSGFVAGLFAVHPLHVESVAWIAERKDVLCAFFFLLAILLHIRFVKTRSRLLYAGVIACFVLGLMSKGMIITLPFVLLLVDYWPLQRWSLQDLRRLGPLLLEKLPLFLLLVPAAFIAIEGQEHVKAIAANVPLTARLANAVVAYAAYLGKTFWPVSMAATYPFRAISPALAIMAVLFLVAVTVVVVWQATARPYLAVGWFWYLGMLVPVIGLVQIGRQSMADRYTYLPLIGIFVAVTWLAAEAVRNRLVLGTVGAVAIVLLGTIAYQQAEYWQDSITLFRHALAVIPDNPSAEGNLGEALLTNLDYQGAIPHFRAALAAFPADAHLHNELGAALGREGKDLEAREEYQKSLQLAPGDYDTYMNLGALLSRMEDNIAAIDDFRLAAKERPDSFEPHVYLALVLAQIGKRPEAIAEMEKAISIDAAAANSQVLKATDNRFDGRGFIAGLKAQR